MWFGEFGLQYRLVDTTIDRVPGITFDLYAGGRYTSIEVDIDTRGELSVNQKVDWIDPLVGGRLGVHLSEHWFLLFMGDVGGFGVGSDLAWSVTGLLGYRWQGAGVEWAILAGYRAPGPGLLDGIRHQPLPVGRDPARSRARVQHALLKARPDPARRRASALVQSLDFSSLSCSRMNARISSAMSSSRRHCSL